MPIQPISGIYTITHAESQKKYVGSSVDIRKRWWEHRKQLRGGYHHSPMLQRAWNKYGEDSFIFSTILICEKQELVRYEQGMIDSLGPFYNCYPLAYSSLGYKHTEESKKRMGEGQRKYYSDPAARKKASDSHKGIKPSPEAIEKNRQSHLGKIRSKEHCENLKKSMTNHWIKRSRELGEAEDID